MVALYSWHYSHLAQHVRVESFAAVRPLLRELIQAL